MKSRHVSKVIDVFQRTCSCLLDTWKNNIEIPGSHYFSFFALSNLLTQACLHFRTTGQLTSANHAKCTFIITETTLNIEHREHRHVSKMVDMFFKELVHVYKTHGKKNIEIPGSHYFSFFALSTQKPVYIFAGQGSSLLLNMQNVHWLFTFTFVCLSVPTYCILMQLNSQKNNFHWYIILFLLSNNRINMK